MQWLLGSQVRIEGLDGGKESVIFLVPCKRSRVIPFLLTFGEAEGPIEKITDVGENLARRTGGFGAAVVGETGGGVADSSTMIDALKPSMVFLAKSLVALWPSSRMTARNCVAASASPILRSWL